MSGGAGWTLGTITTILENPRYTGRQTSDAVKLSSGAG